MPNPRVNDFLAAQQRILEAVPDIGVVLTRERYLESDGWISLFTSLNPDGAAKGVQVSWTQMVSQTKGPTVGAIQRRDRFTYEVLYPYNDDLGDGLSSYDLFVQRLEAINNALNIRNQYQPWDLNMSLAFPTSEVEHQFLQGAGDVVVRPWNTGSESIKTHYAPFTLDVLFVVDMFPEVHNA